jgi:hypothetical protein
MITKVVKVVKVRDKISTKYGFRDKLEVIANGEPVEIWMNAGQAQGIYPNSEIKVALDSKGKYHVLQPDHQPVDNSPELASKAGEIKDYLSKHSKLLRASYKAVSESFEGIDIPDEKLCCWATSLYIQAVRKFDL